jgi:prepilin-type N-terminal cleavage/methylation domain-containing protein
MLRNLIPHPRRPAPEGPARGFTMLELLVTLTVLVIVTLSITAVLMTTTRGKTSTVNNIESAQAARAALELIASDLRSAGYGADQDATPPQQPIVYVDSMEVIMCENLQASSPTTPPLAYNPTGNPKPKPLDATAWTPPQKYRTGAELIRYTLDGTNDGIVNSNDVASTEAARTRNPDDFVLRRQVLGDSSANIAGFNLSGNERVALIRKPGGPVGPMYTVYLRGLTTPWNWANGPIPATELKNIDRIIVSVTAPSAKPDARGRYAETVLSTEINTYRNVPNWGVPTYNITGSVYHDANMNHVKDGGEMGIPGVNIRLGQTYTSVTDFLGNFTIRAPAGNMTLRHTPLAQYGAFDSPDTFNLTIPPATSRVFGDTLRHGGTAAVTVFEDANSNQIQDTGEPGRSGVAIRLDPAGKTSYTDGTGSVSIFVQTGGYSLSCTPPDSFIVTSTNPILSSMVDGGSASHSFAIVKGATGIVAGKVYRDNNRNGVFDTGEPGVQNVWVGVTSDGGVTVLGYANTNATGDYSIQVQVNDPPHTSAYSIYFIVPNGYYPTSRTAIYPIWLTAGQTISNNNFGVVAYQIITLNASRVLSLGSADLMEKDWSGNSTQHAHGDNDIVLGADAGGTDNISVWFNQYDDTPLFSPSPVDPTGYTRNAANSVLSLVVDTLDANISPFDRPDVATGTQYSVSGNLFVWYNQNSSGNQGYVPTSGNLSYRTSDNGDVQAVLAYDCAGGAKLDLIAGTKSTSAGNGTIEVWRSNDAVAPALPAFTQDEIYPPAGLIPSGKLGEVTAMVLADLDNDGRRDLVVGTRTGPTSGEVLFFKFVSKILGARFVYQSSHTLNSWAVTSLACLDVDGDGYKDVIAGSQTGSATGQLLYLQNRDLGVPMHFKLVRKIDAPGIVTSLSAGDFGGLSGTDLAMGWRSSDTDYGGGVRIYYVEYGVFPSIGTDPSAGAVFNFVPALTVSNFNYGIYPNTPTPPFLTDLAAGVKASPTTGALVVFIR